MGRKILASEHPQTLIHPPLSSGVCSGWGDPHYITFDGTYYTFLDNCTYVLVQQVVPVYGHFRVLVENYFCDARDGLSCPRAITVEYRTARVTLTRQPVRGLMTNQVGWAVWPNPPPQALSHVPFTLCSPLSHYPHRSSSMASW